MTCKQTSHYSYNFLIPGFLLYSVFFLIPILISFYFSFTDWDLFTAHFTGFSNFKEIITDPDLNIGFKNTFIFTAVTTTMKIALGLLLALFLNMGLRTQNYLRTVFFFPVILSSVAVGLLFSSLYHPTHGLINNILNTVGLGSIAPDWLGDLKLVIYSVSFVDVWKGAGFTMVIFLAGLQSVPREYYEAISIDGGNTVQKFRYITLPMIRAAVNSNIIICLISGLRAFDIVYVTSRGGPGTASEVISTIIYRKFSDGYYGLATAGGLLFFIMVSAIVFPVYLYLSKREVEI